MNVLEKSGEDLLRRQQVSKVLDKADDGKIDFSKNINN